MKNWETVEEVLEFAIGEEEKAAEFYANLSEKADKPWMKKIFDEFAQEERGHREKLLKVKEGQFLLSSSKRVLDLKIADYLIEVTPDTNLDYQDALIVAMKKEKAAFALYTNLANSTEDEKLRETFQSLAQEEAKHKLRFETEYEDRIMVWDWRQDT